MSRKEKGYLIGLDVLFIAVALVASRAGRLPSIDGPLALWVMLGLAAFRLGRAVAYNFIFLWLRQALGILSVPDESGDDNRNQVTGQGAKYILGELVSCPICAGTWAAMILLSLYLWVPQVGQVLIYALAAAGLAELTNWASEAGQWVGRWGRVSAGTQIEAAKNIEVERL